MLRRQGTPMRVHKRPPDKWFPLIHCFASEICQDVLQSGVVWRGAERCRHVILYSVIPRHMIHKCEAIHVLGIFPMCRCCISIPYAFLASKALLRFVYMRVHYASGLTSCSCCMALCFAYVTDCLLVWISIWCRATSCIENVAPFSVSVSVSLSLSLPLSLSLYIYIYIYICIHMYIHIYIYMCIHTRLSPSHYKGSISGERGAFRAAAQDRSARSRPRRHEYISMCVYIYIYISIVYHSIVYVRV